MTVTMDTQAMTDETVALEAQVRFFKGLANPKRLKVLLTLLEGERSVGALVEETGIAQAQVSNALSCLRWCGFVKSRQEGRFVIYSLSGPDVEGLLRQSRRMVARSAEALYECVVLSGEEEGESEG